MAEINSELILGEWIMSPLSKDFVSTGGFTRYNPDGTSVTYKYKTHACKEPYLIVEASWKVENGHLIIKTLRSSNVSLLPEGLLIKDKILQLDQDLMVLKGERGDIYRRVRNTTGCTQ